MNEKDKMLIGNFVRENAEKLKETHAIVFWYIQAGWWQREMLSWEHVAMGFHKLNVPMKRILLESGIHYCLYNDSHYYFGIGLEEPIVTEDMLNNGVWFVYTWSD